MSEQTLQFEAEVSRILDIVVHSLYSNKEIFLRELISNASDACDKLRYLALSQPELLDGDNRFCISLLTDEVRGELMVADNGIGMNRQELVENLGTIARSGTADFLSRMAEKPNGDVDLIGQFGVGFYAAFMVADTVEVLTRKAGEDQAWRWRSGGDGTYSIAEAEMDGHGTRISLHLRDDAREYLKAERLRHIVKTYSDHIGFPVVLRGAEGEDETLNAASALWTLPKAEITDDQYAEFYKHCAHAFDTPWLTLHYKAEGAIEYTGLLFVPETRPFDLYDPQRKGHLKLYVKKVFITEGVDNLLPPWLRFVRGVVDSEDLPLNISREMLQHNPVLTKIRSGLTKRLVSALTRKAEQEDGGFDGFWENFGAVLKEGLYEEPTHRDALLKLARFRSTETDGWTTLDAYKARMKPGQEAIYTIAGDDLEALKRSPQLEGFRAKGIEVLLLTDPVDEFWVPSVGSFDDLPFRSVTRGGVDLDKINDTETKDQEPAKEAESTPDSQPAIAALKLALGDAVKDVRSSARLTRSACCLIADEDGLDMHLERMMKQHNRLDAVSPRILEVNPNHPVIVKLSEIAQRDAKAKEIELAAHLLLDQARIAEGEPVADPAAFAERLGALMEKGLA